MISPHCGWTGYCRSYRAATRFDVGVIFPLGLMRLLSAEPGSCIWVKSYGHFKGVFMWRWHRISCSWIGKLQLWCFLYHMWFLLLWHYLKWQKNPFGNGKISVAIREQIDIGRGSWNTKSFPISNIFTFANGFFLPFQALLSWKKMDSAFRAIHTYLWKIVCLQI